MEQIYFPTNIRSYYSLSTLRSKLAVCIVILGIFFLPYQVAAQCGYGGTFFLGYNANSMAIDVDYGSTCFYGGEYMTLTNVKAGDAFLSHSCGGTFDSQITVFLEGNATPRPTTTITAPAAGAPTLPYIG